MNSLIFSTISRLLVGLMLLFSVFLLWRGHNEPGGGFIGGLVAAAGIIVYGLAEGPAMMRKLLRVDPQVLVMIGLLATVFSGILPLLQGSAFLTGMWVFIGATETDKGLALGTPLIFDIGVYLVVVGGVAGMVIALEEEL
ncbi:MAG: multicomponent Na+:H+ antiporter subunit B [Granulosicoccus sp.]|jgi:multicomponent Na+:H+ antiporter subunit B